jgi:hypothetical protein
MLRSHPTVVWVLKYWAPIIFFLGTFIFYKVQFRWGQLFILIPLLLGFLFHASLAILQVPDGNIRYRRLFRWIQLPFDKIVGCGVLWGGGVGYIRLNRFVWPWGRLYFVLDANEKIFGRGDYPLLRFIQEHMKGKTS